MATKRRAVASKLKADSSSVRVLLFTMLLVGLVLAAVNLALMSANTGSLTGLQMAFNELQSNYATRLRPLPKEPEPKMEVTPTAPVLFSVVRYQDAVEESRLRMNLAAPITDFYAESPWPAALSAVLIERKNAGSRDVSVRLFFGDGTETSYLWPSSHSEDGKWVPPCSMSGDPSQPMCPPNFSARYPDLVALTR